MQAVLYIGHGTRVKSGVEEAIQFLQKVQQDVDVSIQEIAFLELAEPDIVQGVRNCVERGATSIAVIPILLLTAQHANEDIPEEVAKAKKLFPHISFTYGRPFGVHDKLIDTIQLRIIEQQISIQSDAEVLIVGRGSSDPAVLHDLREIANKLKQRFGYKEVNTCFLYGTSAPFEEAMEHIASRASSQIFIVPYLLFSGLLKQGIVKKIEQAAFDKQKIILCDSLGIHENVRQVLVERIYEALPAKLQYA